MASNEQQGSQTSARLECLGPYFYSRVFRVVGFEGEGEGHDSDAAPREKYFVKLLSTGPGLFDINTFRGEELKKVGFAVLSMAEAHLQGSFDLFTSCTVEQLDVGTGNALTDMEAVARILSRIRYFAIEKGAEHLGVIQTERVWSSNLLENTGFSRCGCGLMHQNVSAGFQSCVKLPKSSTDAPASAERDSPVDQALIHEETDEAEPTNSTQATANIANTGDHPPEMMYKKTHCIFWMNRGECRFTQTGCLYKHEMPVDSETRKRFGIFDIPRWFKESEYWLPWLQQVNESERDVLTQHDRRQKKGRWSGRTVNHAASQGQGSATATTAPDPFTLSAYTTESTHDVSYRDTTAFNNQPETSAGPISAVNIDSALIAITTTSRRPDREIYRPPGIVASSTESEMRESVEEASKDKDTDVQEQPKGQAKRRDRNNINAASDYPTHW